MSDLQEVQQQLEKTIKSADDALKKDDAAPADEKMDPEARKQLEDAKKKAQELLDTIKETKKVDVKSPKFLQVAKALAFVLDKLADKAPLGIKDILKAYVKIFEAGVAAGAMAKYPEYKKLRDQGVPPDDPLIRDISSDAVVLDWYELIYVLRKAEKEAEEKRKKEEAEKKANGVLKTVKSVVFIESMEVHIHIH